MKLAISNIAWDLTEDSRIASLLSDVGAGGVEIAPTKVWPSLSNVSPEVSNTYRNFWEAQNLPIIAFQSLLFGRADLEIFKSEQKRQETFQYLCHVIRLAAQLKAKILVFGSPKNRLVGQLNQPEAMDVAIQFFSAIAEVAMKVGVIFCIEPNPSQYGCDFVRTAAEGKELVQRVNHPGFRLHLDAGAMILNNEQFEAAIESSFEWLAHFHISEPYLEVIGNYTDAHNRIARTLREFKYSHFVSIEMLNKSDAPNLAAVQSALNFAANVYG